MRPRCIDQTPLTFAKLPKTETFFVKERLISESQGDDHVYFATEDLSIEETQVGMECDHFVLENNLKNFWATSCDPERLFSFGRILWHSTRMDKKADSAISNS